MARKADSRAANALLDSIGIPVVKDHYSPGVRAECTRVARRLRLSGRRVFGLTPIDDVAAVPPVAVQLGVALMELGGSTVAYLDANTHWPAFRDVPPAQDDGTGPFLTRWLFESLALLIPREVTTSVDAVPQLERLLFDGVELFEYVLVDLTGFERLGELEGAVELMEQVIIVAHAGRTRERDLLEVQARLGEERIMGALLID